MHTKGRHCKLFVFHPILKQTLWGGKDIAHYKSLPSEREDIGESWEISGLPERESVVSAGEYAGTTLSELLAERREELVGKKNFRKHGISFPLLVKFIDAREDLSVQVHPNDSLAMRRHGTTGKSEMWYIVNSRPGACVLSGFREEITAREYERRVKECTLSEVLQKHEVRKGDVFYLPAGCVHSIGAGCFICEIQQSSDITYRIYDYGRTDAQGKQRKLHVKEAKAAIDFSLGNVKQRQEPNLNEVTELLRSPYFTTSVCRLTKPVSCDFSALDSFVIVVCTSGACTVRCGDEAVRLPACHTLLAAASCDVLELVPDGEADVLICHT